MYRRVSVKQIDKGSLVERASGFGQSPVSVGLDIAKSEIVVVARWCESDYEKPWSVKNPSEIGELIDRLLVLKECCGGLVVGLESTGTYGEAVRRALTESCLAVHRVSGKKVSDYREIFDGVPSQHDGKDAAMIAELISFGKGTAWPWQPLSESDQQLQHQVQRLHAFRTQANQWMGRQEGLIAKHWPELNGLLGSGSVTLQKILIHYASPAKLAADPKAGSRLRAWGRCALKPEKIQAIIESAPTTTGLPMGQAEVQWMGEVAGEIVEALSKTSACEEALETIAREHEAMGSLVDSVGAVTLCVIWSSVGDPRQYCSSGAFLKALGLNLKELSSGKRNGKLAITKRGPSLTRKFLFFWALRAVQRPGPRHWYETYQKVGKNTKNAKGSNNRRKLKGLIGVMRKLCRSLWYVLHHDLEFEYSKVFPGRPLQKARRNGRRRQRADRAASPTGSCGS
jgi:transposase